VKYTIQQGVERAFSERFKGNLQILIPLLVVLAGVTTWALMPHGSHQKPKTLGIYTIKTSDQASSTSNNPNDKNNNGASAGGTSSASAPGTISPIRGRSASLGATSSTLGAAVSPVTGTTTGGLGGGLGGGGTGGGGTPTTTQCINKLTGTQEVCLFPYQTCTVPLAGLTGAKTIDGTCIVIN
jgi:hypothetical protein